MAGRGARWENQTGWRPRLRVVGRAMTGMASAFLPQVGFRTGAAIKGCSTIAVVSWSGPKPGLIGPPSFRTEAARDPLRQPDQNFVPSTPARYVRGHTGPSCIAKGINLYYRGESGLLWASRRFEVPLQDHRLYCTGDKSLLQG